MQARFDDDGSVLVRLSQGDGQYDLLRQQLLDRGNGTVAKYQREEAEDESLELAQSYADHFNALEKAGAEIDDDELWAVEDELTDAEVMLYRDDDGQWKVACRDEDDESPGQVEDFERSGAPLRYGWSPYIGKRGKNKGKQVGWQSDTNKKDIRYQVKKPEDKSGRQKVLRAGEGKPKKAKVGGELTAAQKGAAKRALGALQKAHGEQVHDRLGEIEATLRSALEKVPASDAEGRADLERRLKVVEHQRGMLPAGNKAAVEKKPATETEKKAIGEKAYRDMARWMPKSQASVVASGMRGEEAKFFRDKMAELADRIATMPKTYEQDGKGDEAIAYLHYFTAGGDWYITEKDKETEQLQAFGLADPFQDGGELGYISINELVGAGAELDFHFTPKTLKAIRGKAEESPASEPKAGNKEPWQMTRAESLEGIRQPGRKPSADPGNFISTAKGILSSGMTVAGIPASEIPGWEKHLEKHYAEVKQALKEGKPVPPNVIADYPDLQEELDAKVDALVEGDQKSARIVLADNISKVLGDGGTIDAKQLLEMANAVYGGTRAQGAHDPSGVYDSLEAGFNKSLMGKTDPTADLDAAIKQAEALAERVSHLPTQTNRSGNKDAFQQFSTPPHYAFACAWLANLDDTDVVLEPTGGTGCLAVQAGNAGAVVHANELDPNRADFLKHLLGEDQVTIENAEHIGAIMPKRGIHPTAVVMNPPFSQTAGRMGDKKDLMAGANHISQALQALQPGGRLVAIVGGGVTRDGKRDAGMSPDSPTYKEWFRKLGEDGYVLRANVGVSGGEYKKYGTNFATRVLIIDKKFTGQLTDSLGRTYQFVDGKRVSGPEEPPTIEVGNVETVPELMTKLEGVRNDRPQVNRQSSGEPGGGEGADRVGTSANDSNAPTATDVLDAGGPAKRRKRRNGKSGTGGGAPAGGGSPGSGGDAGGGLRTDAEGTDGGGAGGGVEGAGGSSRRSKGRSGSGRGGAGKGGSAGGKSDELAGDFVSELRPAELVTLDKPGEGKKSKGTNEDLGPSLYENYEPYARVEGAKPHPSALVESAAMSGVKPPLPTYQPMLSPDLVEGDGKRGMLSGAQLEAVIYAGQAHQQFLPAAEGTAITSGSIFTTPAGKRVEVREVSDGVWKMIDIKSGKELGVGSVESIRAALAAKGFTDMDGRQVVADNTYRRGFFIGDGTGVGKGREVSAIIIDNVNQGRKKNVWVSQKQNLLEDARRDYKDLGMNPADIIHFDKIRKASRDNPVGDGIGFITYDTLKGKPKPANPDQRSNVDKLVEWLGPDFDGVIAFDEAHGMANAITTRGARGAKKPSARALAGLELQQRLPNARILYVSATGATEVSNLAYAERLGIWGRETPFATKEDFIGNMQQGGVAAMEAVAQSLKATGGYIARSLSFDDGTPKGKVTYDRVTHKLTDDQLQTYNGCADAWQVVLQNIDKALAATGGSDDKNARTNAKGQFWGAQQRFFNQVITSMQTPSVINAIEKDLKEGRAPVIQLVNTMESATVRALKKKLAKKAEEGDESDDDFEELDITPREVLANYLDKSFPTQKYENYIDADGNELTRPVVDSNGDPVHDPEAVRMRDEMLDMVGMLKVPESPLDMIINHFGHENVAECTGRTKRVIYKEQEDGTRKKVPESRNIVNANAAEAHDFQGGKKKILVFSDAGGTGRSYHADNNAENKDQRVHYMLQPGWRADNAVQGLGRTHRTNQAIAPTYRLVEIEGLKAQKRFISTIARRLDQLGALTRGQRQAGGGGLFSAADNIESPEARVALDQFFVDLQHGAIEGLSANDVLTQMGFKKAEDDLRQEPIETPEMSQFLNRLLSLRFDMQGKVFDEFDTRLKETVERAIELGTLDTGVEKYPAEKLAKKSDKTVYTHPSSGAEVKHFVVNATVKTDRRSWKANEQGELPRSFVKDIDGKVWSVYKASDTTNAKTGEIVQRYRLRGPGGDKHVVAWKIDGGGYQESEYEAIEKSAAKAMWETQHAEIPATVDTEENFLTGAMLPIWDRIPGEQPKIYRLKTDDGQMVVGRHIPKKAVPLLLRNLGVGHETEQHTPADVHQKLSAGHVTSATLTNGWKLKPVRVEGERHIELTFGASGVPWAAVKELEQDGVIKKRIQYDTRFFVPVGPAGEHVLARITKARPIVEVEQKTKFARYADLVRYQRQAAARLRYERAHKYATTQFNLIGEPQRAVLALSHEIRDQDLSEEGREDEPHVTCLYGLHGGFATERPRDTNHARMRRNVTSSFSCPTTDQ